MDRKPTNIGEMFIGAVTLGERGQIVIPAEAREEYDLKPGDKLLVFRDPKSCGLMITRVEDVHRLLEGFAEFAKRLDELTEDNSDAS